MSSPRIKLVVTSILILLSINVFSAPRNDDGRAGDNNKANTYRSTDAASSKHQISNQQQINNNTLNQSVVYSRRTAAMYNDKNEELIKISGRAIKGVLSNTRISAYTVTTGYPSRYPTATTTTKPDGSFTFYIPRWKLRRLNYLELSSTGSSRTPSTMICDAYQGCGMRNGAPVMFGDTFPLSNSMKLRSVIKLDKGYNHLIANFSPLKHMAVARAENMSGRITWNNIKLAEKQIADSLLLNTAVRNLPPVNLLSSTETNSASTETLVAAIIEAAFLNMGSSAVFVSIEETLNRITELQGQFQSYDPGTPSRISMQGLILTALENIPENLEYRAGIRAHLENILATLPPIEPPVSEKPESKYKLLTMNVTGNGYIREEVNRYSCDTKNCEEFPATNSDIKMIAVPDDGYELSAWSGDCSGNSNQCQLTMNEEKIVTATFIKTPTISHTLVISINENSWGTVSEVNGKTSCAEKICSETMIAGTSLSLVATPAQGYTFESWSGNCDSQSGGQTCHISMNRQKEVFATFSPVTISHNFSLNISGQGSINDANGNISCSADCSKSLVSGTALSLVATPASGYKFDGWAGVCNGTSRCTLSVNSDRAVTAVFSRVIISHNFSLNISGQGSINDTNGNISCSADCAKSLASGTALSLVATPASGYKFDGWAGACNGTRHCTLSVNSDKTVTAVFSRVIISHNVSLNISGQGSINDANGNISCSADCAKSLVSGTALSLVATPASGYKFNGWAGACNGTSRCTLSVNSDKTVTAVFSRVIISHNVSLNISGQGSINDANGNISCSADCAKSLVSGTALSLVATPASGYKFNGWAGACNGTSRCTLSVNSGKAVTAVFSPIMLNLTVGMSQGGSVSSLLLGLNCTSGTCTVQAEMNASFNLMAQAAEGYEFKEWTGNCTGSSSSCYVTMNTAKSVYASFAPIHDSKPQPPSDNATLTVSWTAPNQREDSSVLSSSEISHYIIQYGKISGAYTNSIKVAKTNNHLPTEITVPGLTEGEVYYFAGITVDSNASQSVLSNEVSKVAY